jgi:hypothetical protein
MSRLFEPLVTTSPQYRQRLTPGRKENNDLDQNFGRRSQALTALRSTGLPLRRRNRPQDLRKRLAPMTCQ